MIFICNKPVEECKDCLHIVEMAKETLIDKKAITPLESAFASLIIKFMLEKGTKLEANLTYG